MKVLGAWVTVTWDDDTPPMMTYISFGEYNEIDGIGYDSLTGMRDDEVFYYCENIKELFMYSAPDKHPDGWSVLDYTLHTDEDIPVSNIAQSQMLMDTNNGRKGGTVTFGDQSIIVITEEDK